MWLNKLSRSFFPLRGDKFQWPPIVMGDRHYFFWTEYSDLFTCLNPLFFLKLLWEICKKNLVEWFCWLISLLGGIFIFRHFSPFFLRSANVFPSTWARPACRLAMPVGSCTVWSTESSRTGRCRATRAPAPRTTPSTPSSAKRDPASTFPERFSWISSPRSSVRA